MAARDTAFRTQHFAIESEEGAFFIRSGSWRIPLAAWWALVLIALLSPLAAFGMIFWVAGRSIAWRCSRKEKTPIDASLLMALGRWLLKLFWLPAFVYLRMAKPRAWRAWKSERKDVFESKR